jgi:hypothetical protein
MQVRYRYAELKVDAMSIVPIIEPHSGEVQPDATSKAWLISSGGKYQRVFVVPRLCA